MRLATLAVLAVAAGLLAQEPAAGRRVVIVGFDGMDPDVVADLGADELPNLHRLMSTSGARELATTTPAESPVSWAAMITGRDPGHTGIYDFLYHARRDAAGQAPAGFGYRPRPALLERRTVELVGTGARVLGGLGVAFLAGLFAWLVVRLRGRKGKVTRATPVVVALAVGGLSAVVLGGWPPWEFPGVEGRMQTRPFWEAAAEQGVRVRTLTVPMTFPAACDCRGDLRVLAGLGVPDIRGTNGTYHVWTTSVEADESREFGGLVRPAQAPGSGAQSLEISGPVDFVGDRGRITLSFTARLDQGRLHLDVPGNPPLALAAGEWSEPVPLRFPLTVGIAVTGLARFYMKELSPDSLALYLAPMSFHPEHLPPTVPITHPHGWAEELAVATAPFKTLGWAADTWALADGFFDEETFCEDLAFTFAERRELLRLQLEADDWDLLFAVFEATDRASHMLWRHLDAQNPLHDASEAAAGADRLYETYRWADDVVGEVLARHGTDANTLVLVVSDHGFASFRRGVNLNAWLRDEGYLALQSGADGGGAHVINELYSGAEFFSGVDWRRTSAFGLGLGTLYLNVHGLDPEPRVSPSESPGLASEIAQKLLTLEDDGVRVISSVAWKRPREGGATGHELVMGDPQSPTHVCEWGRDAPELVVGFIPGYRVSWQSTLGGIPADVFEDNTNPWSGDHCSVDPAAVAGFLAGNRPLHGEGASVFDIAPTALEWLQLEPDPLMSGESLLGE